MFKSAMIGAAAALAFVCATAVDAAPKKLQPADPQPGQLRQGLSVRYAYPEEVKSLNDAAAALRSGAKRGKPLKGLDYRDTQEGQPTLTSNQAQRVVADIRGYIRFDAPGIYELEFWTNDGLRAKIGGQTVGYFDGRQPCESTVVAEVEVPQAGWYKFDALYFQRLGTACLMMRRAKAGGSMEWVKNSAFGY